MKNMENIGLTQGLQLLVLHVLILLIMVATTPEADMGMVMAEGVAIQVVAAMIVAEVTAAIMVPVVIAAIMVVVVATIILPTMVVLTDAAEAGVSPEDHL